MISCNVGVYTISIDSTRCHQVRSGVKWDEQWKRLRFMSCSTLAGDGCILQFQWETMMSLGEEEETKVIHIQCRIWIICLSIQPLLELHYSPPPTQAHPTHHSHHKGTNCNLYNMEHLLGPSLKSEMTDVGCGCCLFARKQPLVGSLLCLDVFMV